jgi:hypothetical protein
MQIRRVIARNFRGIRRADWTLPHQRLLCLWGSKTLRTCADLGFTPRVRIP